MVLDSLPKSVMKETLQMVCRELDLSEISEIQACLAKLKAVVKAVPRMENFISTITNYLINRNDILNEKFGCGGQADDSGRDSMDKAVSILERYYF